LAANNAASRFVIGTQRSRPPLGTVTDRLVPGLWAGPLHSWEPHHRERTRNGPAPGPYLRNLEVVKRSDKDRGIDGSGESHWCSTDRPARPSA